MTSTIKHERETYATGGSDESNDCSVRAFAVAACVDYYVAHDIFAKAGRRPRHKTAGWITESVMVRYFPNVHQVYAYDRRMTIKRFVELYPKGHYLVHVRGHALAVCDGVTHNWTNRPRQIVRRFWQLV